MNRNKNVLVHGQRSKVYYEVSVNVVEFIGFKWGRRFSETRARVTNGTASINLLHNDVLILTFYTAEYCAEV